MGGLLLKDKKGQNTFIGLTLVIGLFVLTIILAMWILEETTKESNSIANIIIENAKDTINTAQSEIDKPRIAQVSNNLREELKVYKEIKRGRDLKVESLIRINEFTKNLNELIIESKSAVKETTPQIESGRSIDN